MLPGSSRFSVALLFAGTAFAAGLYFPPSEGEWQRVEPAAAGWDGQALQAALDFAGGRRSTAVVVLYRGRILAERQWDPEKAKRSVLFQFRRSAGGQILEDVASVQKSVTAVLASIAREKGLVRLDDPVVKRLGPGWSKAPPEKEARITLRHLMTMTGGLKEDLTYVAEPGTKWFYNTAAYRQTGRALEKASGKNLNGLTREWLTGRIGMNDTLWRDRGTGAAGLVSTARDMARFGLLVLAGGEWNGHVIVKREYLRECLTPSQELNPAYGLLWWLNGYPVRRAARAEAPVLIASAPKDLVAALGAMGRKIYVVPSLELVVTRTGDTPDAKGQAPFEEAFWKALMLAAPR